MANVGDRSVTKQWLVMKLKPETDAARNCAIQCQAFGKADTEASPRSRDSMSPSSPAPRKTSAVDDGYSGDLSVSMQVRGGCLEVVCCRDMIARPVSPRFAGLPFP